MTSFSLEWLENFLAGSPRTPFPTVMLRVTDPLQADFFVDVDKIPFSCIIVPGPARRSFFFVVVA